MSTQQALPFRDPQAATHLPSWDRVRLGSQLRRVHSLMIDGQWRTFTEIRAVIGRGSEASISARLRELRKPYGFTVERRPRGEAERGLWEYRVTE